jgi:lysophospholipase L1-like esterase
MILMRMNLSRWKWNTYLSNIRVLLYCLLVVTVAATQTACGDRAELKPLDQDAVILAFGDSLTYGTGTSRDFAYPAMLQQNISRTVINAGVPGEITRQGLARLPGLLQRHQPDLVIICHGGNDILRKLDLAKARQNIQQMIDLAHQSGAQVMLIGVPEFGLFLDDADMYGELAEVNRLVINDGILGDILGKNTYKSDHIHPNKLGYQMLADSISELLRASGALQ